MAKILAIVTFDDEAVDNGYDAATVLETKLAELYGLDVTAYKIDEW